MRCTVGAIGADSEDTQNSAGVQSESDACGLSIGTHTGVGNASILSGEVGEEGGTEPSCHLFCESRKERGLEGRYGQVSTCSVLVTTGPWALIILVSPYLCFIL